jgi:hypothetical protein
VLVPLRLGHLRVEPSVLTAQVRVDGEPVGRGRYEGDLEAGEHVVELTAEGYQPFTRRVRVRAGDSLRMDAALGRTAPRWVLPVAVVSGAALVAGVVVAALLLNDPGPERVPGRWLNVDE